MSSAKSSVLGSQPMSGKTFFFFKPWTLCPERAWTDALGRMEGTLTPSELGGNRRGVDILCTSSKVLGTIVSLLCSDASDWPGLGPGQVLCPFSGMALKLFAYFVCEQSSEESWQGYAVGSVLPPNMTPNACACKGIFSVLDST